MFNGRTPTTPHCNIAEWLKALDFIEGHGYMTLLPGHGGPVVDRQAITETRDYILWINAHLQAALDSGLDMIEATHLEIPEPFDRMTVAQDEHVRSVFNLYPKLEATLLPVVN